MSEDESFGVLLQRYRLRANLHKTALADLAGITRDSIADWENEKHAPRDDGTLNLIVGPLNLSAAEVTQIRAAYRAFQTQQRTTSNQEPLASCTCCYSTVELPFVRQLVQHLRTAQVKVWFAPDDMRGGLPMLDQIERAIYNHNQVIVVLSEASVRSGWVRTEILRAWHREQLQRRYKLFPIRLTTMEILTTWQCFDADTGTDVAAELRARFIPDFTNWHDAATWNTALTRLVDDLRMSEGARWQTRNI